MGVALIPVDAAIAEIGSEPDTGGRDAMSRHLKAHGYAIALGRKTADGPWKQTAALRQLRAISADRTAREIAAQPDPDELF